MILYRLYEIILEYVFLLAGIRRKSLIGFLLTRQLFIYLFIFFILFLTFCDRKQVVYDLSMAREGWSGKRMLELRVLLQGVNELTTDRNAVNVTANRFLLKISHTFNINLWP